MSVPLPTRPDPILVESEHWSQVLYPIAIALACAVIGFVLAVRL